MKYRSEFRPKCNVPEGYGNIDKIYRGLFAVEDFFNTSCQ